MPKTRLLYRHELDKGLARYLARQMVVRERQTLTIDLHDEQAQKRLVILARERTDNELLLLEQHLLAHQGRIPEAKLLIASPIEIYEWECKTGIWMCYERHVLQRQTPRLLRWLTPARTLLRVVDIQYVAQAPSRNRQFLDRLLAETPLDSSQHE